MGIMIFTLVFDLSIVALVVYLISRKLRKTKARKAEQEYLEWLKKEWDKL